MIGTLVCLMFLVTLDYLAALLGGESIRAILIHVQANVQNRSTRSLS